MALLRNALTAVRLAKVGAPVVATYKAYNSFDRYKPYIITGAFIGAIYFLIQ